MTQRLKIKVKTGRSWYSGAKNKTFYVKERNNMYYPLIKSDRGFRKEDCDIVRESFFKEVMLFQGDGLDKFFGFILWGLTIAAATVIYLQINPIKP